MANPVDKSEPEKCVLIEEPNSSRSRKVEGKLRSAEYHCQQTTSAAPQRSSQFKYEKT